MPIRLFCCAADSSLMKHLCVVETSRAAEHRTTKVCCVCELPALLLVPADSPHPSAPCDGADAAYHTFRAAEHRTTKVCCVCGEGLSA